MEKKLDIRDRVTGVSDAVDQACLPKRRCADYRRRTMKNTWPVETSDIFTIKRTAAAREPAYVIGLERADRALLNHPACTQDPQKSHSNGASSLKIRAHVALGRNHSAASLLSLPRRPPPKFKRVKGFSTLGRRSGFPVVFPWESKRTLTPSTPVVESLKRIVVDVNAISFSESNDRASKTN